MFSVLPAEATSADSSVSSALAQQYAVVSSNSTPDDPGISSVSSQGADVTDSTTARRLEKRLGSTTSWRSVHVTSARPVAGAAPLPPPAPWHCYPELLSG